MAQTGQIIIPASTADKLAEIGNALLKLAKELQLFSGRQSRVKPKKIPKDQEWYWTPEWQQMEREADEDLANGNYKEFNSVEEMLAELHAPV